MVGVAAIAVPGLNETNSGNVAEINGTGYETLQDAFAAAHSGETILLLANLENIGSVSLPAGVTLDGDGKNITGNSAIYINANGGTVQNVNFKNIHNDKGNLSAIYGNNLAGTATITGCSFDNCDWDALQITPVAGANVIVTNNTFSDDESDGVKQQRYIHVQSKTNVDFSATITENVMPGKLTQEPLGVYYPTDKSKVDLTKNYIESINDVCILVADNNGYAGELVFPAYTTAEKQETYSPVAMIQNGSYAANFYAKLQDAINAGEGKTVKLLANINLDGNAANISKAVTIEGDGHTISSTATQAIAISGSGNVTINNTVVSAKNRGINVLDVSTGFTLNVNNSIIQSQVKDPTTTYTIGSDSRGINVANADGVTVNITNSTIQGFSYDINIPATGTNLTVNVTGGKTYGRDIVNNWGSDNTFNLNGVEVHGLNNQTGSTEAFSCIVDNEGCQNNNYIIEDCQFIATLSEAAMAAEGSSATEQMIDLRGTNSVATVKGNTTYTINEGAETRGGIVTTEVYLMPNKGNIVRFDDTAKQNFVSWAEKLDAFDFADKDDENYWPLTFVAQVQLAYPSGDKYYGKYLKTIKSAFEDEKYGDKTQITLLKDVTLDEDLTCPLTEGQYFIMNMSDYAVTRGDYSIALVPGATVYSTKQTDIFSSANADFKVVETEEDGGFAYTVVAKDYVAQIGEGENAVQYESLEKAIEAISTVTTVNHPKSGLTINQYKANGTVTLLADCEGNGIVVDSGSELTIDFAGHTYSVTGNLVGSDNTESQGFQLLKNSNVTFKSTAEEPGSITSAKAIFLVQNYSNLTLENMTLDGSNLSGSGAYTLSNNNGNIVINNSTITAKEGEDNFAFDVCRNSSYPSVNVTVKGESVINGNIEVSASGSDAKDGFSLMLEGGTLNGKIVLDGSAKTAMANTPDKAKVSKSNALTDIAAPAGYMWKDNGDETSTLAKLLARVTHCSGKDYDLDEEMWSSTNCSTAAEVEQNVSLNICDDFSTDEWYADRVWVYGELNANLTLGNNQYVYIAELGADANFTGTISAAEGYILVETDVKEDFDDVYGREHKSAKLYTVRRDPNYAKIKIVKTDGTEYGYDALLSSSQLMNIGDGDQMILLDDVDYGYNVPWYPGFDLTIDLNGHTLTNTEGGVLGLSENKTLTIIDSSESKTGKVALEIIANSPVINASSNNNAKLVIESGSVIAPSNSNTGAIVAGSNNEVSITGGCFAGKLSITEGSTATIQIYGGVFSQEPAEEYCAEGYIVIANTDPETKEVYPYTVKTGAYVAEIVDGAKYETLEAAFAAAETGATVKVLTDITLDKAATLPAGKSVTLDLNGKTISAATSTIRNMGNLTVVDNAGNGKIVSTGNFAISVGNNSTTTISNGESKEFAIESVEGAIITGTVTGATININGGTLSASDNAVVAGNGSAGFGGNTINITGGTFSGGITSAGYVACGIYAPNNDVWNITGGTFNITGGAGVVQRAGTVNISNDVVFNVTGSATGKVGDSRVVVPCAAIVFDSEAAHPGMTDAASMNISGGTFIAESAAVAYVAAEGAASHIAISGGKFSSKVPEECCAPNYVPTTEPEDGYYTVQTKEDAGIFVLEDGKNYPYLNYTDDKDATSVSYFRTFTNAKWQSLYIPFDINDVTQLTDKYEFAKVHMVAYATDENGVVSSDRIRLYYIPITSGTIYANMPYLIKLKNQGDVNKQQEIKVENTKLYHTQNINDKPLICSTTNADYLFKGTYRIDEVKADPNDPSTHFFGVGGGGISYISNNTLTSYRWYIKVNPKDIHYSKPTIEFVMGDEDVTGISNINNDDKSEIEGYYTVNGVRSDVPVKGMNIVKYKNGKTKKVMIK